jgi:hypothetical protein
LADPRTVAGHACRLGRTRACQFMRNRTIGVQQVLARLTPTQ